MTECIDHGRTVSLIGNGYLKICYKGKIQRAHRVVYCKTHNIPIESIHGKVIRHTCDNPRCINPEHLIIGTQRDNMADKVSRNRQAMGETNGNVTLTADQVRYIREHYKPYCKTHGATVLARRYGVTPAHIRLVGKGKGWRHV